MSDLASVTQTFRDIACVAVADGIKFDPESVRVEEIRKDAGYAGVRVLISGELSKARCAPSLGRRDGPRGTLTATGAAPTAGETHIPGMPPMPLRPFIPPMRFIIFMRPPPFIFFIMPCICSNSLSRRLTSCT